MSSLHLVELQIDLVPLYSFLHGRGLSKEDTDLGYGVHSWLKAAFGELAPQPWRLLVDRVRPTRILGYSRYGAEVLQRRMQEFADPSVAQVCPDPGLTMASRIMPAWVEGRRLGFQTLLCPVGRKARSGLEKDLFLIKADTQEKGLRREEVYTQWAKSNFGQFSTTINEIRLVGFRLVKQTRPTQGAGRRYRTTNRPQALLEGILTVGDPQDFQRLLARGLGRHRAFGYGMILLRPPS